MFRAFAAVLGNVGTTEHPKLFLLHPYDLVATLELAWDRRYELPDVGVGRPFHRSDLNRFEDTWFGHPHVAQTAPSLPPGRPLQINIQPLLEALGLRTHSEGGGPNVVIWDHLIYAYMIEQTRVIPIFRRVVHEFVHGERLGTASSETQHWLRSTEELFFRSPPAFFAGIGSDIRPDAEGVRRNAYQRLLGMDLNHGTPDNKPYSYIRAEVTNKELVDKLEELFRETWIGIINASNISGAKATDDAKLRDLVETLHDMLLARRALGTLSREEFVAVTTLSWFHVSLLGNNSIVTDLRAQGASEEQRLFKIAQQVGVPAHGLSSHYFEIAQEISRLLLLIETGLLHTIPNAVAALYTPGSVLEQMMRTIITQWSAITGRDLKAGKIAPSEGTRRPALQTQ